VLFRVIAPIELEAPMTSGKSPNLKLQVYFVDAGIKKNWLNLTVKSVS